MTSFKLIKVAPRAIGPRAADPLAQEQSGGSCSRKRRSPTPARAKEDPKKSRDDTRQLPHESGGIARDGRSPMKEYGVAPPPPPPQAVLHSPTQPSFPVCAHGHPFSCAANRDAGVDSFWNSVHQAGGLKAFFASSLNHDCPHLSAFSYQQLCDSFRNSLERSLVGMIDMVGRLKTYSERTVSLERSEAKLWSDLAESEAKVLKRSADLRDLRWKFDASQAGLEHLIEKLNSRDAELEKARERIAWLKSQLEREPQTGESFLGSEHGRAFMENEKARIEADFLDSDEVETKALEMACGIYDETIRTVRRQLRLTGRVDADILAAIGPDVEGDLPDDEVAGGDDAEGAAEVGESAEA